MKKVFRTWLIAMMILTLMMSAIPVVAGAETEKQEVRNESKEFDEIIVQNDAFALGASNVSDIATDNSDQTKKTSVTVKKNVELHENDYSEG